MRWPDVSLAEIGQIVTGSTPRTSVPDFYGGEIPFITPPQLDQIEPIVQAPITLTARGIAKARLLPVDSVLVSCIGSLGKVGIAGTSLVTNQQINAIIFDAIKVLSKPGQVVFLKRISRNSCETACFTRLPLLRAFSISRAIRLLMSATLTCRGSGRPYWNGSSLAT